MAKIILLEGCATSGKSTVQKKLVDQLVTMGKSVLPVNEEVITRSLHSPETRNIDGSQEHLKNIIKEYFSLDYDYIILDRFHFSHIISLGANLEDLKEIGIILKEHDVRLLYFYFLKESIADRIVKTLVFRNDEGYRKHYDRIIHGTHSEEEAQQAIYEYYLYRLEKYEELIAKMGLKTLSIDTTQMTYPIDFDSIIPQITEYIET